MCKFTKFLHSLMWMLLGCKIQTLLTLGDKIQILKFQGVKSINSPNFKGVIYNLSKI